MVKMKNILFFCCLFVCFCGCCTKKVLEEKTEYEQRIAQIKAISAIKDTLIIKQYDSVHITQKNDTIYFTKFKILEKEKIKAVTDTLIRIDTTYVNKIDYQTITQTKKDWKGWIAFSLLLLLIVLYFAFKIYKKKY